MYYKETANICGRSDYMTTISVRISEEEKQKLEQLAKKEDLSMSQIIRKALKEYLNKE